MPQIKRYYFLLAAIFVIVFFLRFYQLGAVPFGLYQDESAIGYNAYSILTTGKDEYGRSLPVYFKSFGDYKLPVYIYATVGSVALFGLNEFAVRFPSALFGSLSVIIFYLFVNLLTKRKNIALIATALLAVNPWALHYNRATFEVSISLFFFILGALFLLIYFTKRQAGSFLFGTICFIIALYSYNLTRLLAPFLYIACLLFFTRAKEDKNSLSKKEFIVTAVISVIFLLPFFASFLGSEGVTSAKGTLITSSAVVQAPLLEQRSYMMSFPFLAKIFFNIPVLTVWTYLQNITAYLSASFFFLVGSSHGNHSIGNVGYFYLFELPFIVTGFFIFMQEKKTWQLFLLTWMVIIIFVAALTRDVPHATRSFFLLVPLEIMSGVGFMAVFHWWKRMKIYWMKIGFIVMGSLLILYNGVYYFASYYIRFPIEYAKQWRSEDKQVSFFIRDNEQKYNKIIFDDPAGFMYTSYLFFAKYPAQVFQQSVVREKDDSEGFSKVLSFGDGKFIFKTVDWQKDYKPGVLIITTPQRKPYETPLLQAFYYPQHPVVFAVKQNIVFYPVQEVAYVAVATTQK